MHGGGHVDKTYGPGSWAALQQKEFTHKTGKEVSEIFMSNKEAMRTDSPVLFLAVPPRSQLDSPISLPSSCIFETEGRVSDTETF